jgi:hypothetical protein
VVECREDTALVPGTWYLWRTGKKKVFLACPVCGGIALVDLCDVEDDGLIVRYFWCRAKGCLFYEEIKLVGWKPVAP